MKRKVEQLSKAHLELVKMKDERDKIIDAYMDTEEFVQVIRTPNDSMFPGFF